ncbi:hypothetical protein Godav_009937 [Gossypium davidsonii]|uniref:Uncharacterized protein n=1 Tax=Gossypium davidsonii TaxID=34287 RepID=A0A7J8SFE3_GOSDV|nr:hypothetical protein [Gossypium davidsonii]
MEVLSALEPKTLEVPYTVQGVTTILLDAEMRQHVVVCEAPSSANLTSTGSSSPSEYVGPGYSTSPWMTLVAIVNQNAPPGPNASVSPVSHGPSAPMLSPVNSLSSRDNAQRQVQKAQKSEPAWAVPLLPPPPSTKRSATTNSSFIDYLSGDTYKSEDFSEIKQPTLDSDPTDAYMNSLELASTLAPSSPSRSADTGPAPVFREQPKLASLVNLLILSSCLSIVGQIQNLSINSKIATQQVNPEDSFLGDLLDFAKAMPSSPSKSNNNPC